MPGLAPAHRTQPVRLPRRPTHTDAAAAAAAAAMARTTPVLTIHTARQRLLLFLLLLGCGAYPSHTFGVHRQATRRGRTGYRPWSATTHDDLETNAKLHDTVPPSGSASEGGDERGHPHIVASTEVESIETPVVGLSSSAAPPQDPTPTIVTTNTTINPPLVCATVAFAESPADSEATFVEFDENGCCVPAGPVGQAKEQAARFLLSSRVEVAISAFVLLNSLLVALATLSGLPANLQWDLRIAEETIGLLLVADFVARWFSSSKETGNHILDVQFAFDVVAIVLPVIFTLTPVAWMESTPVPNWLTEPSALFNLQLLRVFRLQRVLVNLESFAKFERALGFPLQDDPQEWQLQFARVLLSLFTLLSVSTGLIYTAEHEVNPAMGDYFSALYFGMTTLTTVGFGDIAPVTSAGRLVVCGSIVAGVAIVPAQAAALVEAFLARQASRQQPSRRKPIPGDKMAMNSFNSKVLDTAVQCESCGATLHWSDARYCYYCGEDL